VKPPGEIKRKPKPPVQFNPKKNEDKHTSDPDNQKHPSEQDHKKKKHREDSNEPVFVLPKFMKKMTTVEGILVYRSVLIEVGILENAYNFFLDPRTILALILLIMTRSVLSSSSSTEEI
jgi:hypothetical protein